MSSGRTPRDEPEERLVERMLGGLEPFKGLAPTHLAGLARQCRKLGARRGEVIAARASRLPGLFALGEGTVTLALRGPGGEERILHLVSAAQTFGESSALLGRPCPYEARALSDCTLAVVPSAAIFALAEKDPRCARQLIRLLAERNAELLAELEASTLRRGAQRLASFLDSLGHPAGADSYTVRLPATKTVIASRLDMKKETLSRLLRSLSQQGLIKVAQRDITVLDRERLLGLG